MRSKRRSYYFGIGFEVQSGITSGGEAGAHAVQSRSYYFGIGFEVQSGITSGGEAGAHAVQTSFLLLWYRLTFNRYHIGRRSRSACGPNVVPITLVSVLKSKAVSHRATKPLRATLKPHVLPSYCHL
jgi:hypothetical protein